MNSSLPATRAARVLVGLSIIIAGTLGGTPSTGAAAPTLPNSVREYVQRLSTTRAVAVSKPGSAAWELARHDLAISEVSAANHQARPPERAEFVGTTAVVCPSGTTEGPTCTRLSSFQTDRSGRVVTFRVNDTALADRIAVGRGNPLPITSPLGAVGLARLLSAYETGPGELTVVVDLASKVKIVGSAGAHLVIDEDQIRYRALSGQVVQPTTILDQQAPRNPSIKAHPARSVLRIVLFFRGQPLGGQLTVASVGNPPDPRLNGTGTVPVGQ